DTNIAAKVQPNDLLFGVPLVIGARKGLPNFNEFSSEAVISVTRKVELRKSAPGGDNMINETNQMFVIGISNVFGEEFWNSFTIASIVFQPAALPRPPTTSNSRARPGSPYRVRDWRSRIASWRPSKIARRTRSLTTCS